MFSFKRNPMKFRPKPIFLGVFIFLVSIILRMPLGLASEFCSDISLYHIPGNNLVVRDHRGGTEKVYTFLRFTNAIGSSYDGNKIHVIDCPSNAPRITVDVLKEVFESDVVFIGTYEKLGAQVDGRTKTLDDVFVQKTSNIKMILPDGTYNYVAELDIVNFDLVNHYITGNVYIRLWEHPPPSR